MELCKKAVLNINTGGKGEESWEREWAREYNTPQHTSPSADVQRKSRATAEGKTGHWRLAGSEQAPGCFQRQKQSSVMQGLKGDKIPDNEVNICVHVPHLCAFTMASHCMDTADTYTQMIFTQVDGKGSQMAYRKHALSTQRAKILTKDVVLTPEEAARPCK